MSESIQAYPVGSSGAFALDVHDSSRAWRHVHDGYCLVLVLDGASEWRFRSRVRRTAPNCVMLMAPGEVHASTGGAPRAFFAVFVPSSWVAANLSSLGVEALHRGAELVRDSAASELLHALRTLTLCGTAPQQEEQLRRVLLRVAQGADPAPAVAACPWRLRKGQAALTQRYLSAPWRKVDIEAIAKECGLSYHWFEHAFSDHFGLAPYQYVKALRLARARGLMAEGPTERIRNVGDIALAAGYADASHMHRDFRRQQGLRPGVLAKAMHPGWRAPQRRDARANTAASTPRLTAQKKAS